jgi:undecaprenyl-diphosphatase
VDLGLLHLLNGFLARHDVVEDPMLIYSNAAELLFVGLLAVLFFATGRHARRASRRGAIAAAASAGVALAIAQLLSQLVDRARPFVGDPHGVHLFAQHVADPGFPSDHATASFAIAVAVLLRNRRWGVALLLLATLLAVSRVALGIHYPSDVLAGAALGSATAIALWAPLTRRPLHALADRAGALVDRALPSRL